jgi:hypothetical protein
MAALRHLVTVWNPAYAATAMDAHLEVLLLAAGDRPVSLYGGMVELPLVVTRDDGRRWFTDREALTDGRLWAQRDAENRNALEEMGRELRENLLGEEIWGALELTTRTFLSAAEAVFRGHREDPGFDFSGAAVSYAKAVETELNALVFGLTQRELRTARPADREVWVDTRKLDLGGRVPHQTLGTLKVLLERDETVREVLRRRLQHDATFMLGELPYGLERVMELRNPAAHSETTAFGRVAPRRAEILGIGREGLMVRMARVKLRSAA